MASTSSVETARSSFYVMPNSGAPVTARPPEINPAAGAPAGDPTNWDGRGLLSSGSLQPKAGQPTPTFTVRFSTPGTYDYVCVLQEGMVGTVEVLE